MTTYNVQHTKFNSQNTSDNILHYVVQSRLKLDLNIEVQQRTMSGSDNDAASPFNLCPLLLTVGGDVLLSILLTAVLYFHISSCYLLFVVFPIRAGVIKACAI